MTHTPHVPCRSLGSGASGVSLVELSLGIIITVIIVGGVMQLCVQGGKQRQVDEERRLAWSACRDVLEEIRGLPISDLPGLHGKGFDVPGPNGGPAGLLALPKDSDGLPGEIAVKVESSAPGAVLYRVEAAAAWSGVRGASRLDLQMLVAPRR